MLHAFKKLLPERPPEAVRASYIALLEAARNPFFFAQLGVPDTIDGRFEMTVVHLFLIQHRLHGEAGTRPFARQLSEVFFTDMDISLREMGVMDTGLAKRIGRMAKAYNGRLLAYTAAIPEHEQLKAALARNLYGTLKEGDVGLLETMARYVEKVSGDLAKAPTVTLTGGDYRWPDPAALLA